MINLYPLILGFVKSASLLILVVSVCNGAPAPQGDGMNKRDGIPPSYLSTPIESTLQKRQAPPKMPKPPEDLARA
ncbi:uncharacterized protein MELLADRAFT_123541 [Melampsora larici-populina 98AG31]|uniref:Secreted protein n=1 Tax=Melampsora larici-populina (strain 98AG31 / pathotype 3-4-7) TaxID=747676 RepID=F4S0H6_MELLP|nr:uncharacterized protein MELLADRAFT_123541 [Melampsora larici-populina 98AG31]EGG01868.1 secreted protein [Melampsora larici-populina 98AG31]